MHPLDAPDTARFEQLLASIAPDARLIAITPMRSGNSARITLLTIEHADGHIDRLVVRQHADRHRAQKGNIATSEFLTLRALASQRFPAPSPILLDESGRFFDAPMLVVSYLDGVPDHSLSNAPNATEQIAGMLARLHRIDVSCSTLSLPRLEDVLHERLIASPGAHQMPPIERRVRDALIAAWPHVAHRPDLLLHADFWPGNLLWRAGNLIGVVDWEDALLGDPMFDLAAFRLELFWTRDAASMDRFTHEYLQHIGMNGIPIDLPFWDLTAALDPILNLHTWGHPSETEAMMREKLVGFVDHAIDALQRDTP